MIIAIYQDNKQPVASFDLHRPHKLKLHPGTTYWLYLYAEAGDEFPGLQPQERSDVVVLKRDATPDPHTAPTPSAKGKLVQWVQFKADNDLPIPKVIRWAFGWGTSGHHQTFRIALYVLPRRRSQWYLLFSFVGVLFLSKAFENAIAYFANTLSWQQAWQQCIPGAKAAGLFLLFGYVLLFTVGYFFTPKD